MGNAVAVPICPNTLSNGKCQDLTDEWPCDCQCRVPTYFDLVYKKGGSIPPKALECGKEKDGKNEDKLYTGCDAFACKLKRKTKSMIIALGVFSVLAVICSFLWNLHKKHADQGDTQKHP